MTLPLLPLVLDNVPPGLSLALAQEGVPTCERAAGLPQGRIVVYDGRRRWPPRIDDGQIALDVDLLRRQWPEDPFAALVDENATRQGLSVGPLQISETMARVNKRRVRRKLLTSFRTIVEELGGVWLRVAAFPFPYRSAFNLRIDYDEYHAADFDRLHEALAGHEDATSHYVCSSSYEAHTRPLARLRGLDVGGHGYRHHTYTDRDDNLRNIRRGLAVLQKAELAPRGFVAPHGRFHRQLLAAMEDADLPYSSEFSFAYDELPLWPVGSKVMQLPVHPICLGNFLEAAAGARLSRDKAAQLAAEYFRRIAEAKYQAGEPMFFYGHPTGRLGRYPRVVETLFDVADHCGALWQTSLRNFAAWWEARSQMRLRVFQEGDRYLIHAAALPAHFRIGVEYCRGEHVAAMPLNEPVLRFSPEALAFQPRRAERTFRPVRIDQPEGLRGWLRRVVDWEHVTPAEEIEPRTWRHRVKRTLKKWKG